MKEDEVIGRVLEQYCALSGQTINKEKSAVRFSSNTPLERKTDVARRFEVDLSISMGKYLGLPAEWGKSKGETFKFMAERLIARAERWKSSLLSAGGR
ncbi:hypothetical protein LINPERHAP2_LOCUS15264 [Linum perenne]